MSVSIAEQMPRGYRIDIDRGPGILFAVFEIREPRMLETCGMKQVASGTVASVNQGTSSPWQRLMSFPCVNCDESLCSENDKCENAFVSIIFCYKNYSFIAKHASECGSINMYRRYKKLNLAPPLKSFCQ